MQVFVYVSASQSGFVAMLGSPFIGFGSGHGDLLRGGVFDPAQHAQALSNAVFAFAFDFLGGHGFIIHDGEYALVLLEFQVFLERVGRADLMPRSSRTCLARWSLSW
jgi:hypothetical protein